MGCSPATLPGRMTVASLADGPVKAKDGGVAEANGIEGRISAERGTSLV